MLCQIKLLLVERNRLLLETQHCYEHSQATVTLVKNVVKLVVLLLLLSYSRQVCTDKCSVKAMLLTDTYMRLVSLCLALSLSRFLSLSSPSRATDCLQLGSTENILILCRRLEQTNYIILQLRSFHPTDVFISFLSTISLMRKLECA